ncbi:unnamed protein product [Linum tenue]|uniref:Uncharacterized protein n=1 Tax=Linum tenue TaxID=586396 RepID=A0AAV0HD40_9ROSI|nr:unnamed protein product [Linum tenue]
MDGSWQSGTLLDSLADTLADNTMDFDYMDQLLLDGCWLEAATDGSEFYYPGPTDFTFHPSEITNNVNMSTTSTPQMGNEAVAMRNSSQNEVGVSGREENGSDAIEGSKRWWIGPKAPGSSVRDRLMGAIGGIRDLIKDKDALVQIWVPTDRMGRRVLTTYNQPFALDGSSQMLANYRDISINYQFSAEEEDSKDLVGMPGRVFLRKVPEWSPDVRFFRSEEYPRVDHARQHNVCGTLAVPVFEQQSKSCLGVIEIVTTRQEVKYQSELEKVAKALEAVDLRSSEIPSSLNMKAQDIAYQAALPEIQQVLKSACETHNLPLAQTWVPCIQQQGKKGSRHSDENYSHCVSTVDQACFVSDDRIRGFHEACSEHHLLRGQGVAGRAFTTNQPCFSSDVTEFCKTEYPLSHHARMFGLCAAVAIRLRSVHTGSSDFVLEFFLPADCRTAEQQEEMLNSLSVIIQRVCRTLRVVTDEEIEREEAGHSIGGPDRHVGGSFGPPLAGDGLEGARECEGDVASPEVGAGLRGKSPDGKGSGENEGRSLSTSGEGKLVDRKRTKAEKKITLEVLRQHFAGSLKDAAKSLGVCPTTLKRICRQHGITRWPSRKLKKVGHSLQKLQVVMDSVQGGSGSLQIRSFYSSFPELGSPPTSKPDDNPKLLCMQPEAAYISSSALVAAVKSTSSSSCSQGSSSSHSFSSESHQQIQATEGPSVVGKESSSSGASGEVKRVRSEAELHASEEPVKVQLPRAQSHQSLAERSNSGDHPPSAKKAGVRRVPQWDADAQRVKVAYGNEIVRFRMANNWRFNDLLMEIARRFGIDDMSRFDVKYLDDDSEWVLITCDDDVEECIEVCLASGSQTIKLLLQVSCRGV